ncbi:universal stress protein [Aestuariimicrobium soli]|uniref:universal stress protein n=1 Tax=Aestuariimicrobium soli TaxID=2035834 RepID=UPI003EBF745B
MPESPSPAPSPVIVGVTATQSPAVVSTAATLAARLGAPLVCVWVDSTRHTLGVETDGTIVSVPIDPDLDDGSPPTIPDEVTAAVARALADRPAIEPRWLARAGGVAQQLGALARELDACLIVVGRHEPGLWGSVRDFFQGSAGAQLAHAQDRPVLVVPPRDRGQR